MSRTPAETIIIKSRVLNCDGGDGAMGHPRVFLNMGAQDQIDCPYCGRHYMLSPDAAADHAAH